MIEASVTQAPTPNTPAIAHALQQRTERGLVLYRQYRHDIEDLGDGLYLVPSSDGANFYGVNYVAETCSCPDAARHPELVCKHVFAVGIMLAKRQARRARRASCSGCGVRRPLRELVEAFEGNHDGLVWFDGDRHCTSCADATGVSY